MFPVICNSCCNIVFCNRVLCEESSVASKGGYAVNILPVQQNKRERGHGATEAAVVDARRMILMELCISNLLTITHKACSEGLSKSLKQVEIMYFPPFSRIQSSQRICLKCSSDNQKHILYYLNVD